MSKQTAIDWLIEQLKEYDFAGIKDSENYIIKIPAWVLTEKQEKAKQMEKEQLIDFANFIGDRPLPEYSKSINKWRWWDNNLRDYKTASTEELLSELEKSINAR